MNSIENNIASDIRLSRNVVNKESKRSRRDIIFDTISAMSNIFSINNEQISILESGLLEWW